MIKQVLHTARLRMEPMNQQHYDGMRAMDTDPQVMRYISPGVIKSVEDTQATIERIQGRWQQYGFSWWALMLAGTDEMVGAACLQHLANEDGAPLEIGWRLLRGCCGKGYASEAAQAIITFAREQIGTTYLVAVTDPENVASQRVMQRLGMRYVGIEKHYDEQCVVYELQLAE